MSAEQQAAPFAVETEINRQIFVENEGFGRAAALYSRHREDTPMFTTVVKGTFRIMPDGRLEPEPEQAPVAEWDSYEDERLPRCVLYESDLVPFKSGADVIVAGHAYAPHNEPVTELLATVRIGSAIRYSVAVIGDRQWEAEGFLGRRLRISDPEPFLKMPLSYKRAFGGTDFDERWRGEWSVYNPLGCGLVAAGRISCADGKPLPNIELPDRLIRSWKDRPPPAGFGCYGRGWTPRVAYGGTYDEQWRETRAPALPEDFRYDFFRCAHPELQLPRYLEQNDVISLTNLSPTAELLAFQIPALAPAVVMTVRMPRRSRGKAVAVYHEIRPPMNLDTLCVFTDRNQVIIVWRGCLCLKQESEPVSITVR